MNTWQWAGITILGLFGALFLFLFISLIVFDIIDKGWKKFLKDALGPFLFVLFIAGLLWATGMWVPW